MKPIETIPYRGYEINIYQDEDPINPRIDFDNLGTMICFRNRYSLGDDHNYDFNDYSGWEEMKQSIIKNEKIAVILPLFLYDHSGITISTGSFHDRWDSGQVGFIFISKEKCREEYNWKNITEKRKDKIMRYLKDEVETYDQYLRGDVYGYRNTTPDEDSCFGFYGDEGKEQMIAEAKGEIDYYVEHQTV